jgi:hypothetical protein
MVRRLLLRLLALPVLALALWTPAAQAQPTTSAPQTKPPPSDEEKGERSFAFPYALLLIYTLLVLTIVCMPSRKA